ncbi:hypothetical protein EN812_30065 [Mesorhizobium sp. M4B.F.Ca.ET.169.01.1.1]|uniref:hypothetical protein n=1 Tax=Mesorhizobium sp. M4B.F.Ca.ET.169.01.1.1 TaxID=2563949 RepID=UPI001093C4B0|nr:hypothetical protein [Mesorhizobium sp. M4B.F.Ca.ET.169.01.1.1]TGT37445.1 hypothetical protein EN812_30065 [Mesorhizobium sp. M4B.F.Ca.ET.169.01.1.1]
MNKDDKDARDNIGATGAVPRRPGAGHAPESTGLPTKGGDDPLVRFLAENTDLSPKQARELIRDTATTGSGCWR